MDPNSAKIADLELEINKLKGSIEELNQEYLKLVQTKETCYEQLKKYRTKANYYQENLECMQKKRYDKLSEIKNLEDQILIMRKQVENVANTKPYRLAYFLRRFTLEFKKGTMSDRKNFIKWLLNRGSQKDEEPEHKYNLLMEIAKK